MNPDEERMSFASGGALEYNLSGRPGSFSNFLGFDDSIDALNKNVKRGGGNVTVGDIARSFGISLGGLDSFIQLGAILSLREQLVKAGFENPENIKALYNHKDDLLIKVPALKELLAITGTTFVESSTIKSPGLTRGTTVLLNMKNISDLLEFAFTLGHEMYGHVFANRFFKEIYSRTTHTPISSTRGFDFFKETMGLGWEMQMGRSKLCGFSGLEAASYYYNIKKSRIRV